MSRNVVISRSRALKKLRNKLGNPIRSLNSIIVGLHAVKTGVAKKPPDLNVSWGPLDLVRAEIEARGFAIRSLMTVSCDALDHYFHDLGSLPGPLQDKSVKAALRGEVQTINEPNKITDSVIDELKKKLLASKQSTVEVKRTISEFSELYCGKRQPQSIRLRHEKLYNYCADNKSAEAKSALPPKVYFSAIQLLISWRNLLIHDSEYDSLSGDAVSVLRDHAEMLMIEHSGVDINKTIENYSNKIEPTLKDISTLVSILLRYVSAIDESLLRSCDIGRYFKDAIVYEIKNRKDGLDILRKWPGRSFEARVNNARELVAIHGFMPDSFKSKKGTTFMYVLSETDLQFLECSRFEDLKQVLDV
ncbi:MAG: hypothetical protein M0003_18360 [Acidithiobacillus sp.]|nr:hypothetical protein [Acidithiobacillus sp.]